MAYNLNMTYKITAGIEESELPEFIENALRRFGVYQGRAVDYTNADTAPIVMCTIMSEGKILLAKRGYGLADAEGYWSTVNGFIDENKPVKEIVRQEVWEELGLKVSADQILVGQSYTVRNPMEKRAYIVFPCLVSIKGDRPELKLDREHTDFAWIKRSQLDQYDTLDDLPMAIDTALELQNT